MLMQINKLRRKAQSTAEYVTLISLAIGAVTMASLYVKKALAGKVKAVAYSYMSSAEQGQPVGIPFTDIEKISRAGVSSNNEGQRAGLTNEHAFNAASAAESMRTAIAGDLEEAVAAVAAHNIASDVNTWGNKYRAITGDETEDASMKRPTEVAPAK